MLLTITRPEDTVKNAFDRFFSLDRIKVLTVTYINVLVGLQWNVLYNQIYFQPIISYYSSCCYFITALNVANKYC